VIALCDIGGVWPVMRVTAALTDLAVASVQAALALPAAPGGRARPHDAPQSRPAEEGSA
jgi:glutamate-ammonia-ligase adenylyltransferase